MEVRSQQITAGQYIELDAGNFFMLVTTSAAVDVDFFKNGAVIDSGESVESGYKASPPRPADGGPAFDKVKISSATTQTVKWGIARGSGGYDRFSGEVSIIQGSTIAEAAPVSVGVVATALIAAATRKRVIFKNDGTSSVFLGSSAVTTANGAIELTPGQTWIETEGAAAAWYGISAVAGQSVRIQTIA